MAQYTSHKAQNIKEAKMFSYTHITTMGLAALSLFLLAGCSTDEPAKSAKVCPQTAMLYELSTATDYGQDTPEPKNIVTQTALDNFSGDCEVQDDGLSMNLTLNFSAAKGPRLGGQEFAQVFFASVLDAQDNILSKEIMSVNFEFGSDNLAKASLPLHIFIPSPADKFSAANYRVLLGLQLTESQLSEKRKQLQTSMEKRLNAKR